MMARFGKRGKDVSELALDSFIGEAVFIDLSQANPRQTLLPETMIEEGVKKQDIGMNIVLI